MNLTAIWNAVTLKSQQGQRSQITIVAGIVINAVLEILDATNVFNTTPGLRAQINTSFAVIFAYFMAEKLSNKGGTK